MLLFFSILALSVGLVTFLPSLQLALFGDDWLSFHRYNFLLGPDSNSNWTHVKYFLTPYGPEDMSVGLLQRVVGFNSIYYFAVSFFLRSLATLSFIPIVMYLTKSKIATLFAMLFFAVTTIGLETTNWVFNMPTYLSIALFNLFLFFFIKARKNNKIKLLVSTSFFFFAAYIVQSIRMTGLVPFVILLETFEVVRKRSKQVLKKVVPRLIMALFLVLYIFLVIGSTSSNSVWTERFTYGVKEISGALARGQTDLIFYPIVTFGGMFIPDLAVPNIEILRRLHLLNRLLIPSFVIFLLVVFLLFKTIKNVDKKFLVFTSLGGGLWAFISSFIFHYNIDTLSSVHTFLLVIGGYALIITFSLLLSNLKQERVATAIFLSVAWSFTSFFAPWFWLPTNVMTTTQRYMTVSAVGISILLATIIGLGKTTKSKLILFLAGLVLVFIQARTTREYLAILVNRHGTRIDSEIWASVPYIPELGQDYEPLIFYFEGDGTNDGILFDTLIFGFPAKLEFKQGVFDYKNSVAIDDYSELISAVKDGESLKRFGFPIQPLAVNRIYGFRLEGETNLTNITDTIRGDLQQYTPHE